MTAPTLTLSQVGAIVLGLVALAPACGQTRHPDPPETMEAAAGEMELSTGGATTTGGSEATAGGGGRWAPPAGGGGRWAPPAGGDDGGTRADGRDGGIIGPTPDATVTPPTSPDRFYRMEALDRGVVAVMTGNGVYVGFRLSGLEYRPFADGAMHFEVLRDGSVVTELQGSTNWIDPDGTSAAEYRVRAVRRPGQAGPLSDPVRAWNQRYLTIPLTPPGPRYTANDASAADLDGDGRYDLVLKWEPNNARDNSQGGFTDPVIIEGLSLEGRSLFRINLGPNIRAGAHYTQFIAMDLDGDGLAEVAAKTAPGTRDGRGALLSLGPARGADHGRDYRNGDGYVLSGPEYLTVFEGSTGTELATVEYVPERGRVADWGDNYGNRVDRFLATPAYLDDTGLPSLVMSRGYYTRTVIAAWNFRAGALTPLWVFDSNTTPRDREGQPFAGQGCHSVSVANVDDDLQQEIIFGAMTVDHDGTGLCSTGLGHGDALHVSDLLPDRPGVEVFMPHENSGAPAYSVRDARTCEVLLRTEGTDKDIGRGVAADVDLDTPGAEIWTSGGYGLRSGTTGIPLGGQAASINFLAYWDATDDRELCDGTAVTKVDGTVLLSCDACASNNGTKSTPTLVADLLGDYREEILFREADNRALRLYSTTDLATRIHPTLMHNPQYRVAVAFQNVGYNQPAHLSYSLAEQAVPEANLRTE